MSEEMSKTIVYPDGEVMSIDKVRNLLFEYWKLNETEKRCFKRMIVSRPSVPTGHTDILLTTKIVSND